ncbi:lipid II:glycine glycyltransferase FemX [Luteimicrobium subarcticum]|uniref:Lipid II:glycine glycyltransferase (Peptidoglycan interpeptide bridge formation enzyme) n=1 Tax=Luteimicrobium subarcticum TaxID=620910 RepID=A0A2M8W429_9MICO|nr:peptidoglycan bridge formation glycyltransferase FemA/FemB family protein [Luteimicrobium subarcticum]PJI85683.1 lipid II:glycine glycyltransferase (peptidoglycan interpeptide bridge formation enzyme) [Luteimicrobium subarcticum]
MASPLLVTVIDDRDLWDGEVNRLGGHPLQLWGWGEVKAHGAWTAHRIEVSRGDTTVGLAQVLVRPLPSRFKSLCYVPRGPVVAGDADGTGDDALRAEVTQAVVDWCRTTIGGVGITLEPDWPAGTPLALPGAQPATNPVLYAQTLILDLRRSDEELMKVMAKKTRQYIRKSEREDLEFRAVHSDAELDACLAIYRQTAERAGFGLHPDDYYRLVRRELDVHSPVFAAFARTHDGGPHDRPVAFVWFAASTRTSFELYGGMDDEGMALRANYGLKWFAIRSMREQGVVRYDVNGLLNDGISTFKRGFADHEDELLGSVDVPFSALYGVWNKALPLAKKAVRAVHR